jgi:methyl-accepting chemotaxis protein
MAIANTIAIGGLSLVAQYSVSSNSETVKQQVETNGMYNSMNENIGLAEFNLRKQIQNYDYVLLRGVDPEMFSKYSAEYGASIKSVTEALNAIDTSIKANTSNENKLQLDDLSAQISEFKTSYKKMNEEYEKALKTFDSADFETGKKVDMLIRDYETKSVEALAKLNKSIHNFATQKNSEISDDLNHSKTVSRMLLLGAMLAFGGILAVVILSISKRLLSGIGADPEDLNNFFYQLSIGNFEAKLNFSKDNKESIAYNSKIMQMRLANILATYKDATNEVNKISEVGIGESKEEIAKALVETKANIRLLKEILDGTKTEGDNK